MFWSWGTDKISRYDKWRYHGTISPGTNRILALIISGNKDLVQGVDTGAPVGNSDHNIVQFSISAGGRIAGRSRMSKGEAETENKECQIPQWGLAGI